MLSPSFALSALILVASTDQALVPRPKHAVVRVDPKRSEDLYEPEFLAAIEVPDSVVALHWETVRLLVPFKKLRFPANVTFRPEDGRLDFGSKTLSREQASELSAQLVDPKNFRARANADYIIRGHGTRFTFWKFGEPHEVLSLTPAKVLECRGRRWTLTDEVGAAIRDIESRVYPEKR